MLRYFLRIFAKIAIIIIAAFFATELRGESLSTQEYKIKSAFIYNFAKFIEWPAESFTKDQNTLDLCIIGKDPFGDALDTIRDKIVKGRKLVIRQYSGIEDLKECHIIFISPSEKKNLAGILEKIKDMHMLTVSDMEGFADRGGMITLNKAENKIRLEINLDAAQQSGLKVSSKLLKLATIIKGHN